MDQVAVTPIHVEAEGDGTVATGSAERGCHARARFRKAAQRSLRRTDTDVDSLTGAVGGLMALDTPPASASSTWPSALSGCRSGLGTVRTRRTRRRAGCGRSRRRPACWAPIIAGPSPRRPSGTTEGLAVTAPDYSHSRVYGSPDGELVSTPRRSASVHPAQRRADATSGIPLPAIFRPGMTGPVPGSPSTRPRGSFYPEMQKEEAGPPVGGPASSFFICLCPAVSYSPTPSPVQYHRRWWA
jgi:hypothetical protein